MSELTVREQLAKTADVLSRNTREILTMWKSQIEIEIRSARGQTQIVLEDHMPEVLGQIANAMRTGEWSANELEKSLSKKHGRQRAGLSNYTLEEVLEEYRIARVIIIRELTNRVNLSAESQSLIHQILDRAVLQSGSAFAKLKAKETQDARVRAAQAQVRAEIASQAKTDFLANMSHEIRTPLGAILGFTELMREANLAPSDRIRFAEIVNRNGRQLSALINDILDISKIEAGQMTIELMPVSLPSLIAQVTTLLREAAEKKGIRLNVDPWENIPESVCSDPTKLMQILTNIVGNAIKFTSSGEVRVSLRAYPQISSDTYGFEVTDTGEGISDQERTQLFQSFVQADSSTSRRHGGSGLGLFLSRKIARALGGDLILSPSSMVKGSRFIVTFEGKTHDSSKAERVTSFKVVAATHLVLAGMRILLAEDAPDNQLLITRYLSAEGALLTVVNNGLEAVEMARAGFFDLILMDIQMPLLDGYAATRRLRDGGYRGKIFALTANAMAEDRDRTTKAGFDAHLAKPIHRAELVRQIALLNVE